MRIILIIILIVIMSNCGFNDKKTPQKSILNFSINDIEEEKQKAAKIKEQEIKEYILADSANRFNIIISKFDTGGNRISVSRLGFGGYIVEYKYNNNIPIKVRVLDDAPYYAIIKYSIDSRQNTLIQRYIKIMKSEWEKDNPDTMGTMWIKKFRFNNQGQLTSKVYEERHDSYFIKNHTEYIYDDKLVSERRTYYPDFIISTKLFYKNDKLALIEEYRDKTLKEKSFFNNDELIDSVYYYDGNKIIKKAYYSYKR